MSTEVGGRASMVVTPVTIAATAKLLVAARTGRASVTLTNEGAVALRYGPDSSVTVGTGALLVGVAGTSITLAYAGDIWAITGSSAVISVTEIF